MKEKELKPYPFVDKYQRLGREHKGALGLCKKLEENQKRKK